MAKQHSNAQKGTVPFLFPELIPFLVERNGKAFLFSWPGKEWKGTGIFKGELEVPFWD